MEIDFIHGKKKNTLFYKRGVIMRVISGIVEIKSDGRDALNNICQTRFTTYRRHELPFNTPSIPDYWANIYFKTNFSH
jgi:hypothetical protein